MDDQLRHVFGFKLCTARQIDENIWLRTYTLAGNGNALSTFDVQHFDKICQELAPANHHVQWAIYLSKTTTEITMIVVSTPDHLDRDHVNIRSLLDLRQTTGGQSHLSSSSTNHIAMALSESLLPQYLHFKIDLQEQIVDDQAREVFAFTTIHFAPQNRDVVVIDGRQWISALQKNMDGIGLHIETIELSHCGQLSPGEWNALNCFILLRVFEPAKQANDNQNPIVNPTPKLHNSISHQLWSSLTAYGETWAAWIAFTLLCLLVSVCNFF